MTRTLRRAALGTALALVALAPAQAQQTPTTTLDALTASVAGNTVTVSGKGTFTAAPVEVATDPTNDHFLSGVDGPSGTDLTRATIEAVNPRTLRFTLTLDDLPTADRGTPEVVNYNWPILADGKEFALLAHGQATGHTLMCITGVFACSTSSGDVGKPIFSVNRCTRDPNTGQSLCSATRVQGAVTGATFSWTVPATLIEATEGATLEPATDIAASLSLSGVNWYTGGTAGDTMFQEASFEFPTPKVSVGIAPAGTPDESVALTTTVTANTSTGAFSAPLPRPATSGAYKVVAKACFGTGSCAFGSVPLTI